MKRIISAMLCTILLFGCVLPAEALFLPEPHPDEEVIIQEEDGSYFTSVVVSGIPVNEARPSFMTKILDLFRQVLHILSRKQTVAKTKYLTYYDSKGNRLWQYSVGVSFTYSKYKVKLTDGSVWCYFAKFDDDFENVSHKVTRGDDFVSVDFEVRQSKLGVPLKTTKHNITIRCDKNGNVT